MQIMFIYLVSLKICLSLNIFGLCRLQHHESRICVLRLKPKLFLQYSNKIQNPDQKIISFRNRLQNFYDKMPHLFASVGSLKLKIGINDIIAGVKVGCSSLLDSLKDGEIGYRGEEYTALQLILCFFILFGVPNFLKFIILFTSASLYISGFLVLLSSMWATRNQLSFFLRPKSNNTLVTTDPYSFIRHPMYFGISLMSIGSSILKRDIFKLALSLILLIVFDKSATQEELWLQEKYSEYDDYATDKYKIIVLIN